VRPRPDLTARPGLILKFERISLLKQPDSNQKKSGGKG
jgi:hypothetical protein